MTKFGEFFEVPGSTALRLLSKAGETGMLDTTLDRWPVPQYCIFDSVEGSCEDRDWALSRFFTEKEKQEICLSSDDHRVVAHREPFGWWRVMLLNRVRSAASFRTIKEPSVESSLQGFETTYGWQIYPILMDADPAVHRKHLSVFREEMSRS